MNKSQAIKLKCLDCNSCKKDITLCHLVDCPLWSFRFGYSMKDKRYKRRMKAAKKNYPEEYQEMSKLIAEYNENMPNSSENEQIDTVLEENAASESQCMGEIISSAKALINTF